MNFFNSKSLQVILLKNLTFSFVFLICIIITSLVFIYEITTKELKSNELLTEVHYYEQLLRKKNFKVHGNVIPYLTNNVFIKQENQELTIWNAFGVPIYSSGIENSKVITQYLENKNNANHAKLAFLIEEIELYKKKLKESIGLVIQFNNFDDYQAYFRLKINKKDFYFKIQKHYLTFSYKFYFLILFMSIAIVILVLLFKKMIIDKQFINPLNTIRYSIQSFNRNADVNVLDIPTTIQDNEIGLLLLELNELMEYIQYKKTDAENDLIRGSYVKNLIKNFYQSKIKKFNNYELILFPSSFSNTMSSIFVTQENKYQDLDICSTISEEHTLNSIIEQVRLSEGLKYEIRESKNIKGINSKIVSSLQEIPEDVKIESLYLKTMTSQNEVTIYNYNAYSVFKLSQKEGVQHLSFDFNSLYQGNWEQNDVLFFISNTLLKQFLLVPTLFESQILKKYFNQDFQQDNKQLLKSIIKEMTGLVSTQDFQGNIFLLIKKN